MEFITVGNTQLRVSAFKDWTFEMFKQQYKGLMNVDLKSVWNQIERINGTSSEGNKAIGETDENFKRKKYHDVSIPKRRVPKADN